jgi:predicted peptidase
MNATGVILIATLVVGQRPAHPDVVARFRAATVQSRTEPIPYRLHIPIHSGTRPLPLVIWFHGRGEAGDDNRDQLAWLELVFGRGRQACEVAAVVLAVQCPRHQASWTSDQLDGADPLDRLDQVVEVVLEQQPIDRQRVYLAGISQGASACWQYARRHPHRFAGLLPMATGPIAQPLESHLAELPIWAFQSLGDGPAQIRRMRQVVAVLGQRAKNSQLTVVPNPDHDCWTAALVEYRAWRWLLDQRRGQPERSWTRTIVGRHFSRQQFTACLLALTVTVVGLVGRKHYRRGRLMIGRWSCSLCHPADEKGQAC